MKAIKSKNHRRSHRLMATLCIILFIISGTIIIALLLGNEAGAFVIRVQDGTANESIMITTTKPDENNKAPDMKRSLFAPGVSNFIDNTPRMFIPGGSYDMINKFTESGENGLYLHYSEEAISLYCYTFYIVNTGSRGVNVSASMSYKVPENSDVDEIVRVMTFTNDPSTNNEVAHIYQKPDKKPAEYKDYPSDARLTYFPSSSIVFDESQEDVFINYESYAKYSILFWLEGEDPESDPNNTRLYNASIEFDLTLKVAMGSTN